MRVFLLVSRDDESEQDLPVGSHSNQRPNRQAEFASTALRKASSSAGPMVSASGTSFFS